MIKIHPNARISKYVDIEPSVRGSKIVIGEGVVIDNFVKIKPAGGLGDVVIQKDSVINSGCVIYTGNGVLIGERVAIAANCTLAPVNHQYINKDTIIRDQGFASSKGGIVIEDDVWIGAGSVILDGAYLKKGSVIAAMSLVRGVVPENSIYAGVPAVNIGQRE